MPKFTRGTFQSPRPPVRCPSNLSAMLLVILYTSCAGSPEGGSPEFWSPELLGPEMEAGPDSPSCLQSACCVLQAPRLAPVVSSWLVPGPGRLVAGGQHRTWEVNSFPGTRHGLEALCMGHSIIFRACFHVLLIFICLQ